MSSDRVGANQLSEQKFYRYRFCNNILSQQKQNEEGQLIDQTRINYTILDTKYRINMDIKNNRQMKPYKCE